MHRIAAAAVVVVVLAGCGSAAETVVGSSTTSPSTSTDVTATTTTGPIVTVTVVAPTSATVAATSTTAASGGGGGGGGGGGSSRNVLDTPTLRFTGGGTVSLALSYSCGAASVPGWTVTDCQQMPSYSNGMTVLEMRRNSDGSLGVAVLFGNGSNLVDDYLAVEPSPGTWDDIVVVLGDFHHDDGAEAWIGYRYSGSGGYLDLDVVDPLPDGSVISGSVLGLQQGSVDLKPGGAVVQSAVYASTDAECCPSRVLQQRVYFDGDWYIESGTVYSVGSAPAFSIDI